MSDLSREVNHEFLQGTHLNSGQVLSGLVRSDESLVVCDVSLRCRDAPGRRSAVSWRCTLAESRRGGLAGRHVRKQIDLPKR